jgi:hypothetical protein
MNPKSSVGREAAEVPVRARAGGFWETVEAACRWRLLDPAEVTTLPRWVRLATGASLIVLGTASVLYNLLAGGR